MKTLEEIKDNIIYSIGRYYETNGFNNYPVIVISYKEHKALVESSYKILPMSFTFTSDSLLIEGCKVIWSYCLKDGEVLISQIY